MLRKDRKPKSKGAHEIVTLDIKRWRQMLDSLKNSKKATIVFTSVELLMIEMMDQIFTSNDFVQ